MKEKQVKIGSIYHATSTMLSQPFKGEVLAKWVSTAIIVVHEHSIQDDKIVYDLKGRIAVKYSDLTMV